MKGSLRRVRRTGSLSAEERLAAASAKVPSRAEQKRYFARLAAAVGNAKQSRRSFKTRTAG